jgi:hypothetical protein
MKPDQPTCIEADKTRSLGLNCRTDRLEPDKQPLPKVGHARWIRWYERQSWTPRQRLTQSHPRMDAERLSRE